MAPGAYGRARDAVWDFAVNLHLPAYFWLGLQGLENVFSEYDFISHLVSMDWTMVLYAVLLAIASTLGAALYPTWRASSISPATTLRIQ